MVPLLRRLAHVAALAGLAAVAAAFGRWLRDPQAEGLLALVLLAAVAAACLRRLYGRGGVAQLGAGPDAVGSAPADGRGARATPAALPRDRRRPQPARPLWVEADRVDLNAAGLEELLSLPGVGPVTARRILEHRARRGAFSGPEDLESVPGFGPARVRALADRLRF